MKNEQITRKQHPVPQNIMEVEFKLIGDMTIRQFGYIGGAAVLCFLIYSTHLPAVIRWGLIIMVGLLGLGVAFLPVEERGLDEWIRNFFNACYSPTQRLWGQTKEAIAPAVKPAETPPPSKAPAEVKVPPPVVEAPVDSGAVQAKLHKAVEAAKDGDLKGKELEKRAREISLDLEKIMKDLDRRRAEGGGDKEGRGKESESLRERLEATTAELLKIRKAQGFGKGASDTDRTVTFYEEKIKTLEEKNKALEQLSEGMATQEVAPEKLTQVETEYRKQLQAIQAENESLRQKMGTAEKELVAKQQTMAESAKISDRYTQELSQKESELKRLEDERNQALAELTKTRHRLLDLKHPTPSAAPAGGTPPVVDTTAPIPTTPPAAEESVAPIIEPIPNVINGLVKGQDGKLLSGIMVVVEDEEGDPVRALKTNKLGQFIISTPLPNGFYTVKVVSKGLNFMPTNIKVDGTVLKPIVFKVL